MSPVGVSGGNGVAALVCASVRDQVMMARLFWNDRRLRAPVIAIWVASFGGSLHEPITTFFTLELGATTAQIGKFGVIRTLGTWTLAPFYGWLIDRYNAFTPTLLSGLVCALGCGLRGFTPVGRIDLLYAAAVVLGLGAANFWNCVSTHLACATDREMRHLVVSAFFVQVTVLELLGKTAYPFWDAGLKAIGFADDKLVRFRITMSICTFFCILGLANLAVNGAGMREVQGHVEDGASPKGQEASPSGQDASPSGADSDSAPTPSVGTPRTKARFQPVTLMAVSAVLVFQSTGQATVRMLWPLYTRLQFGWEDHAYAWLSLSGSVACIVAVAAMPALVQRVGTAPVATLLCGSAAVGVLAGFPADAVVPVHIVGALLFISSAAALKPCLEVLASLAVPVKLQGRAFAALRLFEALGQILGNYVGTRLFDASSGKARAVLPAANAAADSAARSFLSDWSVGGGALPFMAVGALLFLSTTILAVALLPQRWAKVGATGAASATSEGCAAAEERGHAQDQEASSQEASGLVGAEQELVNLLRRGGARTAGAGLAE